MTSSRPWPFAVAVLLTASMFGVAFVSMTSVRPGVSLSGSAVATPVAVTFRAVPEAPPPTRMVTRRRVPEAPRVVDSISPAVAAPRPPRETAPADTAAVRSAVPAPAPIHADTGTRAVVTGAAPVSDAVARGAAIAPAGLTAHSPGREAATIAAIRDSALKHLGPSIAERARTTPPSAETQDRLGATQAAVRQTAERTTSAGNSRDIHVPMGQGVGGVGAVGGGGGISVAAPFLSGGKSREQRARDSAVDAANHRIMSRLAARLAAKRDSIRRDSLRADSLRKLAQARKREVTRDTSRHERHR